MARNDPQVNFRIPAELKEKLEESAKESGRSITSELVLRLEQSFATEEQARPFMLADRDWLEEIGVSGDEFTTAMKAIIRSGIDNLEKKY